MLDLSASDMDLVTDRPVSHVKVADAAEVQNKFYKFGPLLGRGAYGTVMMGTERTTGDKWAIKILNKAQCGQHQLALFQREIRILRAVRHPHIIRLERVLESPSALFLVLELCVGELADIAKKKTCFSENEVRRVIQCIASAVTYLHSNDIVHRDLKMENLLVAPNPKDPNDKLYIKVTDFGLSVVRGGIGQENMLQEMCGTPAYMAPELFGSRMYSQQCDIWAMGVITYVMLTGKFPFEPHGNKTLPMVVASEEPDMSGPAFKGDDKEPLKKILRKMLEKNPAYRANARDVETDPWTRNAAEEAPSENVMELMRMWRKDMRSPSLVMGSAGAGAFSETAQWQRRGSRSSNAAENVRQVSVPATSNKYGGGGGGGGAGGGGTATGSVSTRRKATTRNTADASSRQHRGTGAEPAVKVSKGKSSRIQAAQSEVNDTQPVYPRSSKQRSPISLKSRTTSAHWAVNSTEKPICLEKDIEFFEAAGPIGVFSVKNRPGLLEAIIRSPTRSISPPSRGLVLGGREHPEEEGTTINLLPSFKAPPVVFPEDRSNRMSLHAEYRGSPIRSKFDQIPGAPMITFVRRTTQSTPPTPQSRAATLGRFRRIESPTRGHFVEGRQSNFSTPQSHQPSNYPRSLRNLVHRDPPRSAPGRTIGESRKFK